ncbi:unnamed protein product [Brassica napus]|uniref:(rape) hypothetical protein n=1 Tax=Brassica napus TaxID=3708 RepID=A0A816XXE9_BRANA|nr:unnamed protein product [Brassica napus]
MAPLDATPMSKAKDATSSAILIGRNTIIIGDQPSNRPTSQRALIGQTAESAQGRQNASFERASLNDTAAREAELLDDDMLTEEQAKHVTMTAEDEAEVDRLVSEFGDVIMDENMMENDDLLVDEPGFDAEKIDAISQLSPMQVQNEPDETMGQKNLSSHRHEKSQRAEHETKKHATSVQPMLKAPLDMIATDKGRISLHSSNLLINLLSFRRFIVDLGVSGCRFCLPVLVLSTDSRLRRLISSCNDRPAFASGKRRLPKRRLRRLLSPGDDVLLRIVLAGTNRSAIQFFVVRLPLALFFR